MGRGISAAFKSRADRRQIFPHNVEMCMRPMLKHQLSDYIRYLQHIDENSLAVYGFVGISCQKVAQQTIEAPAGSPRKSLKVPYLLYTR